MGYFDSPKNRAMWNIELSQLKQEREARKNGDFRTRQEHTAQQVKEASGPKRERVTYKQLLAEEQAGKKSRLEGRRAMVRAKEREKTAKAPEL